MEQHTDYFMINMEEAKKIIARLIDLKYITGDEALILFEAINKPGEIKIEPITVPVERYPYITWDNQITHPDLSKYTFTCSDNK